MYKKTVLVKVALLSILVLASTGAAVVASAYGLRFSAQTGQRIDVNSEALMVKKLTPEQKARARDIALGDPQVQEMLKGADRFLVGVFSSCRASKIGEDIVLIPRDELAAVQILVSKDSNTTHLEAMVLVDLSKNVIESSGPISNLDLLTNVPPDYFETRWSLLQWLCEKDMVAIVKLSTEQTP